MLKFESSYLCCGVAQHRMVPELRISEADLERLRMAFWELIALWFSICGGIWLTFQRLENDLRKPVIARLSRFLVDAGSKNWAPPIHEVLDVIFGPKHLSLRCFATSAVVSVTLSLLLLIPLPIWSEAGTLASWLAMALVLNVLPDYISLGQTRYIVLQISACGNRLLSFLLVLLDIVLTVSIFALALYILDLFLGDYGGRSAVSVSLDIATDGSKSWFHAVTTGQYNDAAGAAPFFFTTFSTSFWLWLYLLGIAIVRVFGLARYFKVKSKPLRTLGWISMVLVTAVFAFSITVAALFKNEPVSPGFARPYVTNSFDKMLANADLSLTNFIAIGDDWLTTKLYFMTRPQNVFDGLMSLRSENRPGFNVVTLAEVGNMSDEVSSGENFANLKAVMTDGRVRFDGLIVSMGMNDLFGVDFLSLIRSDGSKGEKIIDENMLARILDRVHRSFENIIALRDWCCPDTVIYVNSYDYFHASGKADEFIWGLTEAGGSDLKSIFSFRGVPHSQHDRILTEIIHHYSRVLKRLAASNDALVIIPTLGTLRQEEWSSELTPSPAGFAYLARVFARTLVLKGAPVSPKD